MLGEFLFRTELPRKNKMSIIVAKIKDNVVVNIEIADEEWIQQNDFVDGFRFIPTSIEHRAHIGLRWSEEDGFEQPRTEPYADDNSKIHGDGETLDIDPQLEQEIEEALSNGQG